MTVGELITQLQKFDHELPVKIISEIPYPSDVRDVLLTEAGGYVQIQGRYEFQD
jgi:hypothetical protein